MPKQNIIGFKGLNVSEDPKLVPPEYAVVARNIELYRKHYKKVRAFTTDTECLINVSESVINFMEFDTAFINAILMVTDSGVYINRTQPQDLGAGSNYLLSNNAFTSHNATKALKIYTGATALIISLGLRYTGDTTQIYIGTYDVENNQLSLVSTDAVDISPRTTLESEWVAYTRLQGSAILWYNILTEATNSNDAYTKPPSFDWNDGDGGPVKIDIDIASSSAPDSSAHNGG